MNMNASVEKKVPVVTGGSSGIGLAFLTTNFALPVWRASYPKITAKITNYKMTMKTKTLSTLGSVAVAAAFFSTQTVRAQDLTAAAVAASNIRKGPVLASPHDLEEFPWLTRPGVPQLKIGRRQPAVPDAIRNNQALSNSPRVREEYPALTRVEQPPKSGESAQLRQVRQNVALANSPRVREEFPELQRESWPQSRANSTNIALSTATNPSDRKQSPVR
jgi:hypothetical protein